MTMRRFAFVIAALIAFTGTGAQAQLLPKADPAMYTQLRTMALGVSAKDIAAKGQVYGVIMETAYAEGVFTMVAFEDGTASLYLDNGGGFIGMGEHEGPRTAARALVSFATRDLSRFSRSTDTSLPKPGRTRFYLLTQQGRLTVEASENDLGEGGHALSPLFYKAHDLITAMRKVDEARRK